MKTIATILAMLLVLIACAKDPGPSEIYGEVIDWEGNSYRTILYETEDGPQTWMIDNLLTNYYNNGDRINLPYRTGQYSFNIIKVNNICPIGWHVPLYWEWGILTQYYTKNHIPHDINGLGYWWSGSELHDGVESEYARAFYVNSNTTPIEEFITLKDQLLSIRCIKDISYDQ